MDTTTTPNIAAAPKTVRSYCGADADACFLRRYESFKRMVSIKFFTTDFASHRSWATGYQRATWKQRNELHDVRLEFIPGDRWKYRMMSGCSELLDKISLDDEIVVVDAMIDVSLLVALLGKNRSPHQSPKVLVYFHENQLTTPFTDQDRDQKRQTHWHYGLAHWRSLIVADGCVFNSKSHLESFAQALPKLINEQCPRDTVEDELKTCLQMLETKCTVLPCGLELDELRGATSLDDSSNVYIDSENNERVPVILWNARLEEDKDPVKFIELLHRVRETIRFKLIILGADRSKGQKWFLRLMSEFGETILHMGWCSDRAEYSSWLKKASVVVSTAMHETFGVSIVESAFCGVLPLLPRRLSYPDIFSTLPDICFYDSHDDADAKLLVLAGIVAEPQAHNRERAIVQKAVAQFCWENMLPRYQHFFASIAKGDSVTDAGNTAAELNIIVGNQAKSACSSPKGQKGGKFIEIIDCRDPRIQLYRPKSLRDYNEFNRQVSSLRSQGMEPALHGGRRAIIRLLEAQQRNAKVTPISFLTTKDLADSIFRDNLMPGMQGSTPPIYIAQPSILNKIRGQKLNLGDAILAMIHFPQQSSFEEIISKPPILILENVRNSENIGTILRTAFCLGISSIIATTISWSAIKDSRSARCSMGTQYYHDYFRANDSASLVEKIKVMQAEGITVYGVEIDERSRPIAPHGRDRRYALVVGNEDVGLSSLVAAACDALVEIPQASGDSLNVAVAASIGMHALRNHTDLKHDGLASCP